MTIKEEFYIYVIRSFDKFSLNQTYLVPFDMNRMLQDGLLSECAISNSWSFGFRKTILKNFIGLMDKQFTGKWREK